MYYYCNAPSDCLCQLKHGLKMPAQVVPAVAGCCSVDGKSRVPSELSYSLLKIGLALDLSLELVRGGREAGSAATA